MALKPWPSPTPPHTPDQYDRSSTPVGEAKKLGLLLPWFPGEGCFGSPRKVGCQRSHLPNLGVEKAKLQVHAVKRSGSVFLHPWPLIVRSLHSSVASQEFWTLSAPLTQGRGSTADANQKDQRLPCPPGALLTKHQHHSPKAGLYPHSHLQNSDTEKQKGGHYYQPYRSKKDYEWKY